MPLTSADVNRIAQLARIEISPAETSDMRAKLDGIFALFGELSAVDTTGIVPMAHAQDAVIALREDAVTDHDQHLLYQQHAPATEGGLYLVPKVID